VTSKTAAIKRSSIAAIQLKMCAQRSRRTYDIAIKEFTAAVKLAVVELATAIESSVRKDVRPNTATNPFGLS
jgi:hypothetical protein